MAYKKRGKYIITGEGQVILYLKGNDSWEDYFVSLMKSVWKMGKRENERIGWKREWIEGALEIIKFEAKEGIKFFIGDDEKIYYENVKK